MKRPDPFDLKGFLRDHPEIRPSRPKTARQPARPEPVQPNRTRDAISKARHYITTVAPAISGQHGHAHTFGVAIALIHGLCLKVHEALPLMEEWNHTCLPPWSRSDLEKKLIDAESATTDKPDGWILNKQFSPFANFVIDDEPIAKIPAIVPIVRRPHSGVIDDPASLACRFIEANRIKDDLCRYRWMNGIYYRWNDNFYDKMDRENIDADIGDFVESEFLKQYNLDCLEVPDGEGAKKTKKYIATHKLVDNVKLSLVNQIAMASEDLSEPFWVADHPDGWDANHVIPFNNKLLHLNSYVTNQEPSSIPKTPKFFSTYSLDYAFNFLRYSGPIDPPPNFRRFVESVFPGDHESIECLQEIFGYLLTPDTSLHKLFMLIGQKRSGKGTIIRLLYRMLGERNVCSPTFKSLTTQFGKQPLIGKTLAVFPDARITGRTDIGDVVECLLSISGEDTQTIDRKNIAQVDKRLSTRFLISSNELPRLTEASGALVTRAIILKFDRTFLGNEDTTLEDKLKSEIPHILRWSIDGWSRLNERKQFNQPSSGQQYVDDLTYLSSPIIHFIADNIDQDETYTSNTRQLFESYKSWCNYQNRDHIGDMMGFVRSLNSAIPNLKFSAKNITYNGDGVPWSKDIIGVRLRPIDNMGWDGRIEDDLTGVVNGMWEKNETEGPPF